MQGKARSPSPGDLLTAEEVALFDDVTSPALRRLLLAALESFAAHGYEATTTRHIADRAGMSGAAIYGHYRSKQELLVVIVMTIHRRMLADMRIAFVQSADPRLRLAHLVRVMVTHHAHLHTASRVATYELRSLAPENRRDVVAIRDEMEAMVTDALRLGRVSGSFRFDDLRVTTMAVLSLAIDISRWYTPSGRLTPATLSDLYVPLVETLVGLPAG